MVLLILYIILYIYIFIYLILCRAHYAHDTYNAIHTYVHMCIQIFHIHIVPDVIRPRCARAPEVGLPDRPG